MAFAMRAPDGSRPPRPRNRAFHDARSASADCPGPDGYFLPVARSRSTREQPTSDTPVTRLPRLHRRAAFAVAMGAGNAPRSIPLRCRDANGACPDPGCLPSARDSRHCIPISGYRPQILVDTRSVAHRVYDGRLLFTRDIPRSTCRCREASSFERTALRRMRSREDFRPRARPPCALSPKDVGNAFAWAVAAYRLLQTKTTYRHTLERPFLTRTGKRGAPHGARSFSCVGARTKLTSFPEKNGVVRSEPK